MTEGGTIPNEKLIKLIRIFGILLIFIGIVLNPFVIEQLFVRDKNIESTYNIVFIIIFEVILIIIGLFLFLKPAALIEKRKEIGLLIITFVVCFLFLEIGSRIYLCSFLSYEEQTKYLLYGQCGVPSLYSPHHYLTYYGTPNYQSPDGLNIHNSYGFRGPEVEVPKPEGVYRIVVLGGSTTYTGVAHDWQKDFPRQLQKELQNHYNYSKIEVINAGLSGWTSWESLINLEFRLLDFEPDLIIDYDGINDVSMRLVNPQYYKGDNFGARKIWGGINVFPIFYSTFIRLITGINPSDLGHFVLNLETSAISTRELGFIQKLNGTALETLEKNKPIYFERNLRNMIAIVREHNISIILVTWAHNNKWDSYATTPHYEMGILENNNIVKEVGESHNIPVYDFASEMSMDEKYWSEGIHLNELGLELQGELFAKYIVSSKIMEDQISILKNKTVS